MSKPHIKYYLIRQFTHSLLPHPYIRIMDATPIAGFSSELRSALDDFEWSLKRFLTRHEDTKQ